jgi:hypothetical protein
MRDSDNAQKKRRIMQAHLFGSLWLLKVEWNGKGKEVNTDQSEFEIVQNASPHRYRVLV